MSDQVKKYKVLHPILLSGRCERGEIVDLHESKASKIGPRFLEEVDGESSVQEEPGNPNEDIAAEVVPYEEWPVETLRDHARARGVEAEGEVNEVVGNLREADGGGEEVESEGVNYEDMTKKELQAVAKDKGLSTQGKKDDLIVRLQEEE